MKKILLLFALIAYCNISVLGQYTVKIRIGIIDSTKEGWEIHVSYADVFNDNGELIPYENLPGGTSYVWEQDQCQLGQGFIPKSYLPTLDCDGEVSEEGDPNPTITCDNSLNFSNYLFRVKVTINNAVFLSDTVRFPDSGSGSLDQKIVNFDQRREGDNNSIGMIGKLTGNSFLNYVVPFTYCYPADIQDDIYRASQSLDFNQVTQQYEKYSHWIGFADVVNHKKFTLNQYSTQLTSQFNKATDATVKANMLEFPEFPPTVNFKDPWLIDDDSDPLGLRNRGVLADPLPWIIHKIMLELIQTIRACC